MRILVIDDDRSVRAVLSTALTALGHEAITALDAPSALKELARHDIDLIFLDLFLEEDSGLDLILKIVRHSRRAFIVMLTAHASLETAVEAMRRGAFDYLAKPCTPEQLRQILNKVTTALRRRKAGRDSGDPDFDVATQSPAMRRAVEVAHKAAASDATVLLLGETGTGKSVLARNIHRCSARAQRPILTVNCPSLSSHLLESELFGHMKGAFTGALSETRGKVAEADGGTLFLDEIGDLPLSLQAKLLRLLQEREYERLGDTRPRTANVRIIAATNRDLKEEVRSQRFREDLFYRLCVIPLTLPPLRERLCDLPSLVHAHLHHFTAERGTWEYAISPEAMYALERHSWPGNLRELRNLVERAIVLCDAGRIELSDLALPAQSPREILAGARLSLAELETEHIRRVVANTTSLDEAAAILNINPATLYRKRKRLAPDSADVAR